MCAANVHKIRTCARPFGQSFSVQTLPATMACSDYRIDVSAVSFGLCRCGFPKRAHSFANAGEGRPLERANVYDIASRNAITSPAPSVRAEDPSAASRRTHRVAGEGLLQASTIRRHTMWRRAAARRATQAANPRGPGAPHRRGERVTDVDLRHFFTRFVSLS